MADLPPRGQWAPPTPVVAPTASADPWIARNYKLILGIMLAIVALGVIGSVAKSSSDPKLNVELCTALRSGAYDHLTASDWRRESGMGRTEIERYVTAGCPEQILKV